MKFSLYYPVKTLIIGQKFGDTSLLPYYQAHGINFKGHNGIDMAATHGQKVYAAHDGTAYPEYDSNQGHGVVVVTDTIFDYNDRQAYFKTIYWHLIDNIPIKYGQKVKAGDLLGYADSTGLSTGDHLHFGLKPVDGPNAFDSGNIEQDNGYMGAIDPTPYFNGKYAEDLYTSKITFSNDLKLGDSGEEVRQIQLKLQKLGYFPIDQVATGYYGAVTRKAVYQLQLDYIPNLSFMAKYIYCGRYFAQQTRAVLNNL